MTTKLELPVATVGPDRYRELAPRIRLLSWLSLGAMSAEGVVAIVAGVLAGSIALVGFGLDSAVEGFASVIIIWRFHGVARDVAGGLGSRPEAGRARGDQGGGAPERALRVPRRRAARRAARQRAGRGVVAGSMVGLLIAGVAVREGLEAWRGEGCCVASPLDGYAPAADRCCD